MGIADCGKLGAREVLRSLNHTSIPEAGGDLIDYFDPLNEDDALAKIERPLIDPNYLAAREAQLRAEYRPRTWADCVHALIGALDQTVAQDAQATGTAAEHRDELAPLHSITSSAKM